MPTARPSSEQVVSSGEPVPERVAGIDFMLALWRSAAHHGCRVHLLDAEPRVVE
jgi:N-acetylglucosaminyldiphosphoundecaprenol N-acetyl-beta-D-mannosaminyltransferase